jgi:hypothetical protein
VVSELFIHAKAQRRKEEVILNHSDTNGFDISYKRSLVDFILLTIVSELLAHTIAIAWHQVI